MIEATRFRSRQQGSDRGYRNHIDAVGISSTRQVSDRVYKARIDARVQIEVTRLRSRLRAQIKAE